MVLAFAAAGARAEPSAKGPWEFPHYGRDHGFPRAADESRERTLRFPDAPSWFSLRIAPALGGVTCFIMHYPDGSGMDGCPRDAASRRIFQLGRTSIRSWDGTAFLFGTVGHAVESVELVYETGRRGVAKPKAGFIAFEIPSRVGRAVRAIIRGADGRVIRQIGFS